MTYLTSARAWLIVFCVGLAGCGQTPVPSRNVAPAPVAAPARPKAPPTRDRNPAPPPRAAPRPAAPAPAAAAPDTGTLHIDSDVPGASVFIDREYVGVTPVTAPNVKPGNHRVNLSAQGYDGIAESLDVEPGPRDLMFKLKEVRLDASIDVIHKHRIGSCKGRLIATPQGLSYDTTNKDDAFSVPLTSMQAFEVDYLAKVLRVKLPTGKQYDFTDPEGNADRLFVFHRDVHKARQQLKGK